MTKRKVNIRNTNSSQPYFQEGSSQKQINHTKTIHQKPNSITPVNNSITPVNNSITLVNNSNNKKSKKYKSIGTQTLYSSIHMVKLRYIDAKSFKDSINIKYFTHINDDSDLEYLCQFINSFQ